MSMPHITGYDVSEHAWFQMNSTDGIEKGSMNFLSLQLP